MKNRKEVKERKRRKLHNKRLCKKYPWLIPESHYYTGRILKKRSWNYSWTWWDDMPKGWKNCFGDMMLEELDKAIRKAGLLKDFGIMQLKEKYGRLEIYCYGFNEEINQIINKYSYISENVCISCGRPDIPMVNDSWISPYCFDCFRRIRKRNEKWYLKNYKDYIPETDEDIHKLYAKLISDKEDDWKITDSYTIRRFSQENSSDKLYNISDTVAKIRGKYVTKKK